MILGSDKSYYIVFHLRILFFKLKDQGFNKFKATPFIQQIF